MLAVDTPRLARIDPIRFIEGALRHTMDRFAGQPFLLRDWQQEFIRELFREVAGIRVYTRGLLGVPKGSGKSALASALGLHGLVADGVYSPEVYAVAGDKYQARIVFDVAKTMVEFSPNLVRDLKLYRDAIEDPNTGGVFRVLSADAPLKHGLRPSRVIFDEVHVQPNRELWDTLEAGLVKRYDAMMIGITTAGWDEDSLLGDLCREGAKGEDPRYLYRWFGLPTDSRMDPFSEEAWAIANPALGDFLPVEGLRDMARRLPESVFRRLHLNQWVASEQGWIKPSEWDALRGKVAIPDGATVVLGVDAGIKHDSTCVVTGWLNDKGKLIADFRLWEPEDRDDEVLDLGLVEAHIRDQAKRYDVREVAYDPYFFTRSAQILEDEGLPMVEFSQSNELMVKASGTLFDLIRTGRLTHAGDKQARKQVLAAVVKETERGWRISKAASKKKIDAGVALAMAAWRLAGQGEEQPWVMVL